MLVAPGVPNGTPAVMMRRVARLGDFSCRRCGRRARTMSSKIVRVLGDDRAMHAPGERQAARRVEVRASARGSARPAARARRAGRSSRSGVGDDRRQRSVCGDLARGGADRVGAGRLGLAAAAHPSWRHRAGRLRRSSAMRSMIATASTGYSPDGGFGRQHHRVGAVVDGGRHVGRLGARRRRRGTIDSSICVATIDRLAGAAAGGE